MGLLADIIMHKIQTNYAEQQAQKMQGLLGAPGGQGSPSMGPGPAQGSGLLGALSGPSSGHLPAMQQFAAQAMGTPGYGSTGAGMLTSIFNQGQARAQGQAQYETTAQRQEDQFGLRYDLLKKATGLDIERARAQTATARFNMKKGLSDWLRAEENQKGVDLKRANDIQTNVRNAVQGPSKAPLFGTAAVNKMATLVKNAGGFERMNAADDLSYMIAYAQAEKPSEAMMRDDVENVVDQQSAFTKFGIDIRKFITPEGRSTGETLSADQRMALARAVQAKAAGFEKELEAVRGTAQTMIGMPQYQGASMPAFMQNNFQGLGGITPLNQWDPSGTYLPTGAIQ